jgi:hypothetical protein
MSSIRLLVGDSKYMGADFLLTAPKKFQASNISSTHDTGVVATIPYLETNSEAGILIANWIFHHVNIGFRVFLYDRNGSYEDIALSAIDRFAAHTDEPIYALKERFTYHKYSIRELLGYDDRLFRYLLYFTAALSGNLLPIEISVMHALIKTKP